MDNAIKKHSYQIFGKPLHPNKQKVLFDLFDIWLNTPGDSKLENEDWQIIGEQCRQITVMNKHTQETFDFAIVDI